METIGEARNIKRQSEMAEKFSLSEELVVDQLKLNAKNKTRLNQQKCD